MQFVEYSQFFVVVCVSLGAAAVILGHFGASSRTGTGALLTRHDKEIALLFEGEDLVDASGAAQDLLEAGPGELSDWDRFIAFLRPRFPDLDGVTPAGAPMGQRRYRATGDGGLELVVDRWDGLSRWILRGLEGANAENWLDHIRVSALETEATTMRSVAEDSPGLIWIDGPDGAIRWTNRAYVALADQIDGPSGDGSRPWPPRRLFDHFAQDAAGTATEIAKLPLSGTSGPDARWYEVTSVRRDSETIHFAHECTAVVRAEDAQRNFVETMGKTFAQLSIGLMIFDNQRRLKIFNPALTDLTGLPFDFLSARPAVTTVLDRLREAQMLPEPKNYSSWRDEITDMESAAHNGTYCENWNLPNGSTYRVTGRPHPDGAIAFLFEDISSEVSLTRHFRSELELSNGIFDSLDDAMAVFTSSGSLAMTNRSYSRLWQRPANASLSDSGVIEESQIWQDVCAPTPIWRDIRDFVSGFGDRQQWEDVVVMTDGRQCLCKISPLPGNATLVSFRRIHEAIGAMPEGQSRLRPRSVNTA